MSIEIYEDSSNLTCQSASTLCYEGIYTPNTYVVAVYPMRCYEEAATCVHRLSMAM